MTKELDLLIVDLSTHFSSRKVLPSAKVRTDKAMNRKDETHIYSNVVETKITLLFQIVGRQQIEQIKQQRVVRL